VRKNLKSTFQHRSGFGYNEIANGSGQAVRLREGFPLVDEPLSLRRESIGTTCHAKDSAYRED
jgi:hypothetical protein